MIRKFLITFVMAFTFSGLFGQPVLTFRSVDVNTFEKAVGDTAYVVLDVRTQAEYDEGHIPGTDLNIDVLDDGFKQEALARIPKDKHVALYCRSGNRSKTAARILSENGYKVVELSTGFKGWAAADRPIEK